VDDPEDRTFLAARIPSGASKLRKLFGYDFDLCFSRLDRPWDLQVRYKAKSNVDQLDFDLNPKLRQNAESR
jgi:hypothetical protein